MKPDWPNEVALGGLTSSNREECEGDLDKEHDIHAVLRICTWTKCAYTVVYIHVYNATHVHMYPYTMSAFLHNIHTYMYTVHLHVLHMYMCSSKQCTGYPPNYWHVYTRLNFMYTDCQLWMLHVGYELWQLVDYKNTTHVLILCLRALVAERWLVTGRHRFNPWLEYNVFLLNIKTIHVI